MEFERNPENFKREISQGNLNALAKGHLGDSVVEDVAETDNENPDDVPNETEKVAKTSRKKDKPKNMAASLEWEITPAEGETTHSKVVAGKFILGDIEEELLRRLSLERANQDVVGVTLPRICGVVQAFYMCCSCHIGVQQQP